MSWTQGVVIGFTASGGLPTLLGLLFDVYFEQEAPGLRTPLEP